jgi:hypothetical protein
MCTERLGVVLPSRLWGLMPALLTVAVLLLRRRRVLRCAAVLVVLVLVIVLGASIRRVVAVLAWRTLLLRRVGGAPVASLLSVGAGSAWVTALWLGRRGAVLGVTAVLRLLVLTRCGRTAG